MSDADAPKILATADRARIAKFHCANALLDRHEAGALGYMTPKEFAAAGKQAAFAPLKQPACQTASATLT